jgi:hypothetical protein
MDCYATVHDRWHTLFRASGPDMQASADDRIVAEPHGVWAAKSCIFVKLP